MAKLPSPTKRTKTQKPPADSPTPNSVENAFIYAKDFFVPPGRKNHLLEHYLPGPGSVTAIIAPPNGGKTTLLAYLAFTYAFKLRYNPQDHQNNGDPTYGNFLGMRMTQPPGPVLFIAREGHRQLQLLGAHENEIMRPGSLDNKKYFMPIAVLAEHLAPKLDKAEDVKELHTLLDAFAATHGRPPGLIILDTARKLLAGEENNSDDVSRFMQACSGIATTYKASVIVAHHTPKSGNATARGSGAWLADTDCEWFLNPPNKEKRKYTSIHVNKLKGFPLPEPLHFIIKSVYTEFEDMDNRGEFLSTAHIQQYKPTKQETETETIGSKAANNLLKKKKPSPEQKHAARQAERMNVLLAAWEAADSEVVPPDNHPYITRAALAEYLATTFGYTEATIKQAMKPSADANASTSIIGPLLADNFIAKHEHGWIITITPSTSHIDKAD